MPSLKKYENFPKHDQFIPYLIPDKSEFDTDIERFDYISNMITEDILGEYGIIDHVYLEGYSFGSSGSLIFNIAENTALLKYKLFKKQIPFTSIGIKTVKKYATGSGNANKQLLEDTFESEYEIGLRKMLNQTDKQFNPSSDIIDSYFICYYGSSLIN